jgi:hypothetical protein
VTHQCVTRNFPTENPRFADRQSLRITSFKENPWADETQGLIALTINDEEPTRWCGATDAYYVRPLSVSIRRSAPISEHDHGHQNQH